MPHRKFQPLTVDAVVGANVKMLRVKGGVDILSAATAINLTPDRYTFCEAGHARFEAMHLYLLSRLLHVSLSDFFCYREPGIPKCSGRDHLKLVHIAN